MRTNYPAVRPGPVHVISSEAKGEVSADYGRPSVPTGVLLAGQVSGQAARAWRTEIPLVS